MAIALELASFCTGLKFPQLPPEVVDRAKSLFLDFIGVASRGSLATSSKSIYRFIRERGKGRGVLIGTKDRAPFTYACLANGTAGHAIEMDDVNNESSLHPGVVIFPTALATAEMTGASGRRLIEAVVAGYEVMVRLGKGLGPSGCYRRGFHPTAICGTFGSSVTASKLLGLGASRMASAMGISGSQAAGSMEFLAEGAWTKRFHAGWAAHSGMIAAMLSQKGFRGPASIIEGRDGFLHAYSDHSDSHRVLEGLGSGFEILRTSVKPHACCRYMQPPIDGLLKIMAEEDLVPEEIERVKLGLLSAGFRLIAEPPDRKYAPQTPVDAQFSMPFGAAVAILYRRAGLREFQPSKMKSDRVRALMRKVECTVDPELDRAYPRQWGATAEILTRDGRRYLRKIEYPKGDPENPLSWEELIEKFDDLSGPLLSRERRRRIVEEVRGLEKIEDMGRWSILLLKDR
ncbi:MAG: MmgE/PrpD family protein [Desulfobacterota bacterium]|nr:MmgE/PrpD family protein [Thermodesulfobacteriota bacterium]